MCCIFTCCGWVIDLVQRLWTFAMSCCISSAVCCLIMTSSMSGIALGYNYSLAEYIDLKETNVSVYIKRGVFDDEIVDDMEWRRSGRMPVAGHIGTDNLITGAPLEDESTPLRSGRRMEDSLFESNDPHKYEGSLMRLTAQPPYPGSTASTNDRPEYVELPEKKFADGSLDQLKAIQSMVDSRKSALRLVTPHGRQSTYPDIDERYIAQLPINNPNSQPQGRRMLGGNNRPSAVDRLNPARLAVPPPNIGAAENWMLPKLPQTYMRSSTKNMEIIEYPDLAPTYPKPIRLNTGPLRPTRPTPTPEMRTNRPDPDEMDQLRVTYRSSLPPIDAREEFREKMLLDKFEASLQDLPKKPSDEPSEDYEDNIKGLPVRRRRHIDENTILNDPKASMKDDNNDSGATLNSVKTTYIDAQKTIKYNDESTNGHKNFIVSGESIETIATDRPNKEHEITDDKSIRNSNLVEIIATTSKQPSKSTKGISNYDNKINVLNKIWNWILGNKFSSKVMNETGLKKDGMIKATQPTLSTIVSVNDNITPMSSIVVRILQSTVA